MTLGMLFAVLFTLSVIANYITAGRSARLREANRDRAMLERYRRFVEGLAEASRRGIFPPELERHCQHVEIALKSPGGGNPTPRASQGVKTRQRGNTGQREASPALVGGVPDRDGDGQPDKPPAISDVLAEVYGDPAAAPPTDADYTLAQYFYRRIVDLAARVFPLQTDMNYGRRAEVLAQELEFYAACKFGAEHFYTRLVAAEHERDILAGSVQASFVAFGLFSDEPCPPVEALDRVVSELLRRVNLAEGEAERERAMRDVLADALDRSNTALAEANDAMLTAVCKNSVGELLSHRFEGDPPTKEVRVTAILENGESRLLECCTRRDLELAAPATPPG